MECSDLELLARYETLFKQYVEMAPKLAETLEKYGRLRKELQLVVVEIKNRKLDVPTIEENNASSD